MTKSRGINRSRKVWNAEEDAVLVEFFPHVSTRIVAEAFECSESSVHQRAHRLGLRKTEKYLASPAACRLRRGDNIGKCYRFPKGHVPANKGLKRPGWSAGRMRETQFKKGHLGGNAAKLVKPIGSERISKDGYLERKINNDLPFQARWRAVHLIIWEKHNGPLPRGYAVTFKDGDKTNICIENLARIHRAELMQRNTVHNLPPELKQVIQLNGQLKRRIRERQEHEEQNGGSSRSSVCGAGGISGQGQPDADRTRKSDL